MQNLFLNLSASASQEQFQTLLQRPGCRVERIVSLGQASPPGFWYDQDWDEWILLLAGQASLQFEGEAEPRVLASGDYLLIPAGARHRVVHTAAEEPTVWLAIHIGEKSRAVGEGD